MEEDHAEPPAPNAALWFFCLLFRPRAFFQHFAVRSIGGLTPLAAWMYGIAATMDRMESRILPTDHDSGLKEALGGSWIAYWMWALLAGILAGWLYYALGAWWYRKRLEFSGVRRPEPKRARRVYLYASQVYVLPFLIYTGWQTTNYESPLAAMSGDDPGSILIMVCLFWSIYTSYRGVRTLFDVRKWPARVWFALLPAAVYGIIVAVVIGALVAGGLAVEPDLRNTRRIDREGFTLMYPGNWTVDRTHEAYDPDGDFSINPELADATIRFWFFQEPMASQECVDMSLANLTRSYGEIVTTRISRWGRFEGAGYEAKATVGGVEMDLLLFASTDRPRPFEVLWLADSKATRKLRPGFAWIRDSFELRE